MKKYDIAYGCTASDLIKSVNNMIENGWSPLGRAFQSLDGRWHQTMVRNTTEVHNIEE